MGKFIDLTGQVFGEWTVLSYAGVKGKNSYWLCRCSCGKEQENRGTHLRGGQTKSCGHNKDISIGSKFGRLTVLEKITHRYKGTSSYVLWKCQCDCGNISYVRTGPLVNHITISCGCYHREQMSEQFAKHIPLGSQFGELTVIEETSERDNSGNILYKVRCSCGKEFIKSGSALRNNIIFSCGHITSKGEYKIYNFLKEHNIVFTSQWNNDNKMLLSSGYPCRFDFAIFHSSSEEKPIFLLEYNGLQHYKAQESGWYTTENLVYTQQRDAEKAKLCEEAGIPLEIIPYTDFDNLEEVLTKLLQKYNLYEN